MRNNNNTSMELVAPESASESSLRLQKITPEMASSPEQISELLNEIVYRQGRMAMTIASKFKEKLEEFQGFTKEYIEFLFRENIRLAKRHRILTTFFSAVMIILLLILTAMLIWMGILL